MKNDSNHVSRFSFLVPYNRLMEPKAQHVCPSCGYEYESWVEVCPDCQVPIVDKRPHRVVVPGKLDQSDPHWTIVTNVPNAIIGTLLKSQLEDAGIPVLMMRSRSVDIAEFSHNDFVPQDLRVPRDMLFQARSIIDSPSDAYSSSSLWEDAPVGDEYEQDTGTHLDDGEEIAGPAGGWTFLPGESDFREQQGGRPSQSRSSEGWYWSDAETLKHTAAHSEGAEVEEYAEDNGPYGLESDSYSSHNSYGSYSGGSYGQQPWIRWVYAVLLLLMSMPFILSVLQNLFSFWHFRP
jgi:hypothetical protein